MEAYDTGKWSSYYEDPFGFMDKLNLTFKGNNLNIFQKYKRLRVTAYFTAIISLLAWIIFGFDSTIGQPLHVLYNLPEFLRGNLTSQQLVHIFNDQYGKEMHWSAFVIYGLMFWYLSRYYEKNIGITKSRNVAYAMALTLLSIGVFEFYWMSSFAYWQNQAWVITPRLPQLRIIMQNVVFVSAGGLCALYMWADSYILDSENRILGRKYKFNWNWKSWLLITVSVGSAVAWWFYPLPVEHFEVTLETGEVWRNSQHFPQTLYTIDLDPTDNVNAGVWFWFENDLVHGLNTLVKVLWTLTFCYVGCVKKVDH